MSAATKSMTEVRTALWVRLEATPGKEGAVASFLRAALDTTDALSFSGGMPAAPTATLLVVDDDATVRALLRRILEPAVCQVIEAAHGLDALRAIERDEPPVDAVLTDLRMPVLSGYEVAAVLEAHRPDLPVMILSSESGDAPQLPHVRATLTKPIAPDTLCATVRSVLETSRAQRARARQQRADAGESRALASWQRDQAAAMRARNADLVAAAMNLRMPGAAR